MRRYYSTVQWQPVDIHRLRPSWTKEQCTQALAKCDKRLEEAMIRAGWGYLEFEIGVENWEFYNDWSTDIGWDDMPEEREGLDSPEMTKEETEQ